MKASNPQTYSVLSAADDLEEQYDAFSNKFIILKQDNKRAWWNCSLGAKAAIGLVILGTIIILSVGCSHKAAVIDVECFHALGGGVAANGGGFDSAITRTPRCKELLKGYLKPGGKYWQEVQIGADRAMQYYKSTPAASAKQVVVFDIDETTLSNVAEFISNDLSAHPQHIKKVHQSNSPAIQPILAVYNYLYAHNYTVTFITGRNEASRKHTTENLEAAGYGKQCPVSNGKPVRTAQPCYLQLDLRTMDDTRFASVYKPDRRRMLVEKGWEVAGSFGDQFSDLEGEFGAKASFKLPNVMYYIL